MPQYLRLATGVAIIAVLSVGALTFFARSPNFGGSSGTPGATSTPAAPSDAALAMTQFFASPAFGFDARHPAAWTVRSGTTQGSASELALGEPSGLARFWDHFGEKISATTTVLPRGMSEDAWISEYQAPQVEQAGRGCIPERAAWETVVIDGRPGGIYVGCQFVEAMVFDGRRIYIFSYFDVNSRQSEVATSGRRLLESFLATVSLHPERVSTPPPVPAGSAEAGGSALAGSS